MSSKVMKASIIIGGSISGSFRTAMSSTKSGLKAIGEEIANVERKQRLMSRSIETFGRMGKNVDHMRQQYASLTREADRLRAAQSRLASVQERIDANNARRQELGGKFRGAVGAFGVAAAATLAPIRTAVQFENAMLGVAKQLNGARDGAGNLTPVFFAMSKQIRNLGREIPTATNDLADMVTAGLRMGVASDQVVDFTRTASMMASAFEMPAGQLADDMGKIAGLFHIPIPRIAELGDAINYLDDNAMSKGGDIIDVLQRVGGMSQALKMPAKEAAALGSTFLTMGNTAETAGTATKAMLRILGAATAQPKRVQKAFGELGMTAQQVQTAMTKDATTGILSVLDALNKLSDEQRLVATTKLFGAEYGGDVAKLATGTDEYRRQLSLVNGEQQRGSMSREFNAQLKTTGAQWQITKNRLSEVSVVIGNALVPSLTRAMQAFAPVIEGFAEWSREHPKAIKGVIGATLALTGLRVVSLGVAYAWTAVQGPVLSVMGFIARWRATSAIAAMGRFGPMAMRIAGVMRMVGVAIAAIGGGPIAIAVAAITAGALIVRKYWEPIKAWVGGVFQGIREAVGPAFAEMAAAAAPLKPVWDALSGAIGKAWDWVVKLLEPVHLTGEQFKAAAGAGRTFGNVIGFVISAGIKQITTLVKLITWVIGKAGTIANIVKSMPGAGLIGSAANYLGFGGDTSTAPRATASIPAPVRGRQAPPVKAAAGRGGSQVTDSSTNTYHITQHPGESGEALAKRIEDERRRREAVARRGSLADIAA